METFLTLEIVPKGMSEVEEISMGIYIQIAPPEGLGSHGNHGQHGWEGICKPQEG
jgi:hypothetical protein